MLQISLSAKKSLVANSKLLSTPSASKKKGSLRQPAKNRWSSAWVASASRPVETGIASDMTFPPLSACAPSKWRRVALCLPPVNDNSRTW
jgi:hypothetical protein